MNGILVDACLEGDTVTVGRVRVAFAARSLAAISRRVWIAWFDYTPGGASVQLASTGVVANDPREPVSLPPAPLPIDIWRDAPDVLQASLALVPAFHRTHGPLRLDFALVRESAAPRWRLQYEVDRVGFRVLCLDARIGNVLHDHFDPAAT